MMACSGSRGAAATQTRCTRTTDMLCSETNLSMACRTQLGVQAGQCKRRHPSYLPLGSALQAVPIAAAGHSRFEPSKQCRHCTNHHNVGQVLRDTLHLQHSMYAREHFLREGRGLLPPMHSPPGVLCGRLQLACKHHRCTVQYMSDRRPWPAVPACGGAPVHSALPSTVHIHSPAAVGRSEGHLQH